MGTHWGFDDVSGPFRGSEAVATGAVTPRQLRGEGFRRIFRDGYVPAAMPLTHEIRCQCAALILPVDAVITGRSAATLRGVSLARVDLALPEHRLAVEYDGMWHGVPLQVGRDRDRLNRLHAAGWDVVFITAQHLRDPRHLIRTVRAALNATMTTSIHVAQ